MNTVFVITPKDIFDWIILSLILLMILVFAFVSMIEWIRNKFYQWKHKPKTPKREGKSDD